MKAMGGEDLHLSDAELKQIVTDWRNASPHIVQLWYDVENAAMRAISGKMHVETHGLEFCYESGFLFIRLPSGRRLAYVQPKIGVNRFGGESLTYMGLNTAKKWSRLETFGGKLVENGIQSIARDLLLNAMKTLSDYRIVAHVHDELIIECDRSVTVQEICAKMAEVPNWAKGLKLRADGYECEFYRKD